MNTSAGMTMTPGSPISSEKVQQMANQNKNQQNPQQQQQQQQTVLMHQHPLQQQQAMQQLQFATQGQQPQHIQPKPMMGKKIKFLQIQ